MAGLSKDGRGWRVTFICPTSQKQRTVRLGTGAKKDAETARNMIERLITARSLGTPINQQTAEWLKGVGDTLRNRLAKNDLTEKRVAAKLGEFTRKYIDGRTDLKASTKKQIEHARTDLVDFFKEDKFLNEITEADAEDWALWLSETRKLGENTKARRVGRARQFFNRAIKENILTENPFRGIKSTVKGNEDRFHFVDRSAYDKLLEGCPSSEWRAIVALSRVGGLRCPSEVLALRWEHVLWDQEKILVPEPKMDYLEGRGERILPLFPELREVLTELFEHPDAGREFVVNQYRDAGQNMRTMFVRIVRRCGLEPWGKPFQNMRASRSTELEDEFPTHVAAKWLGHSPDVARKHYHMVHDGHFERAIQRPSGLELDRRISPKSGGIKTGIDSGIDSGIPGALNAAQHATAMFCEDPQEMRMAPENRGRTQRFAEDCGIVQNPQSTGPRTRTGTSIRTMDFESIASANSASPA
jgi:integrase